MTKSPFQLGDKSVVIPTGGDFQPSGFIGPWSAAVMSSIMTESDFDMKEYGITTCDMVVSMGAEWKRHYWHDYGVAKEAEKTLGDNYTLKKVWVFSTETSNILNFASAETQEKFGPRLTFDYCSVTGLRAWKYRHELQMIAMPAFVRAYAVMMGWENIPDFDEIAELTSQDTMFTDAYQAEMIGDPNSPDEYEQSRLWQYRVKLWNALGEENARAFKLTGSGTKFDVTSPQLNEALTVVQTNWTAPVYLRLVPVQDPRVGGKSKNTGKRYRIPVVTEIFPDKKSAEIAAKADRDRMSGGGETTATAVSSGTDASYPPYPETWGFSNEYKKEWRMIVEGLKKEGLRPVVIGRLKSLSEKELQNEIAATVSDVEAWWDHV